MRAGGNAEPWMPLIAGFMKASFVRFASLDRISVPPARPLLPLGGSVFRARGIARPPASRCRTEPRLTSMRAPVVSQNGEQP